MVQLQLNCVCLQGWLSIGTGTEWAKLLFRALYRVRLKASFVDILHWVIIELCSAIIQKAIVEWSYLGRVVHLIGLVVASMASPLHTDYYVI